MSLKRSKQQTTVAISYRLMMLVLLAQQISAWTPDGKPKLTLTFAKQDKQFAAVVGNRTDYYKLLDQNEDTILVGARNAIYNISLNGLRENFKLEWPSSDADRELCALKGKQERDCQNYIRVFARIGDSQIMICGTNSYKPRCRYYNTTTTERQFEIVREVEAQGRCPYSPQHNSTYYYADGQLYSATVADFSGADPLIFRESLRTEQYDLKQLNQPDFVSAFERNGYVFFFFREIAMEYMNCGKAIYSRVGRVCKNDRGGPYAFADRWTSFLKTRLNCSIPGEYPFYFNEIQSTSKIIEDVLEGDNRSARIYAVFTTSSNAIPGSAVCAFTIADILDAFDGHFKSQKDNQANWLPLVDNIPEPRPGRCVDDSRMLSSTAVNFVKTHTLMETSVPALYGKPLLTQVSSKRLTAITVDSGIIAMDGNVYDMIFVGTDDGKVTKFYNIPGLNDVKTVVVSEMQALPIGMPVRELTISHKTDKIIVIGDGHIGSLPLHHCAEIIQCQNCIDLQDPYCAWDVNNHECTSVTSTKTQTASTDNFIQQLNSTRNTALLCRKFGDAGNRVDHRQSSAFQSSRVSGQNKQQTTVEQSQANNNPDPELQAASSIGLSMGVLNGIGTYNTENQITLTSVDPNYLNAINDNTDHTSVEGQVRVAATSSTYLGVVFAVCLSVFCMGILIGWYFSRRICETSPFHAEHRNQLSPKSRPFTSRNSGKDINLLMNSNPFATVACNNKKDNLDHEFVVGDKDRSHECKNSTENLEKEVQCKTSTLTKVKRTYI